MALNAAGHLALSHNWPLPSAATPALLVHQQRALVLGMGIRGDITLHVAQPGEPMGHSLAKGERGYFGRPMSRCGAI